LTHTAAELKGIVIYPALRRWNPDPFKEPNAHIPKRTCDLIMISIWLTELIAHLKNLVHGNHGVL
jgi:hypothetical protein